MALKYKCTKNQEIFQKNNNQLLTKAKKSAMIICVHRKVHGSVAQLDRATDF